MLAILPVSLALVLAHVGEAAQHRRAGGPLAARLDPVPLRSVLPGWAVWGNRLFAVGPVVVACALQLAARHAGYAHGFVVGGYGALLVLAVVGVRTAEGRQAAILNGSRPTGSGLEPAYDDRFRADAAMALAPVLPALSYLACCAFLQPVFGTVPVGAPVGHVLTGCWELCGTALILYTAFANQAVRRGYYRRGVERPQTPESAPC
jgi:hypothetical protein